MPESKPRPAIETPDWVKDAVFYQIFPDRFAKSETLMKPNNLQPWGSKPTTEGYQGGDLLGVVEHLDYLEDLGINALYFTPIFQSASNHRYHTHDYYRVDPLLGGNDALRTLIEEAHRRNIRVVLDGVFNHASRGFFRFNDILEHGPHSAWLDWFTVLDWPLAPYDGNRPANYVGWMGNRALPKFNTDNPQVREFLMRIGEYWLREYDIDGWRLDVPDEITTPGFWEEFRQRIKRIKPDAYIVAEIWELAPQWLQGEHFDATMNYPFAASTIAFTAGDRVSKALVKDRSYDPHPGIPAETYGVRIRHLLDLYDWEITRVQLNLLDSHDTARLLSIARGDKATVRLAALLLMTFPGPPSIYYGDEICIRGTTEYDKPHQDPDARWGFPWNEPESWDREMLAWFKGLIALRHEHSALRHGRYLQLFAAGPCYAFARQDERETLLVAVNVGDGPREIDAPCSSLVAGDPLLEPLFGTAQAGRVQEGRVALSLPPRSGTLYRMARE